MSPTTPLYLLISPQGNEERVMEDLAPLGPVTKVREVEDLFAPAANGGPEPGWILVPAETEPVTVVSLLTRLARERGEWSPLLIGESNGVVSLIPLSPGFELPLVDAADQVGGEDPEPAHLSVRRAMRMASRIRHDINNPLTAALAEVQLLLMDVDAGSEMEAALQTVERQLRRIASMVTELLAFREPKS